MSKEHKAPASAKDLPPPFRLVLKDGSQHDFWGYDKLYAWCKADKARERWVGLILSSAFVLLFGSVPIRYVEDDGCLSYMTADLAWKRFDAGDKKTGEATLTGEATF